MSFSQTVKFNQPIVAKEASDFVNKAIQQPGTHGVYSSLCSSWFENQSACKVLLTHSCTGALEMAALLADLSPGDEVIVPSYTFVSTALAFVRAGGVPVFVDSNESDMNMDIDSVAAAITTKTKAIVCVHYAGNACDIDALETLCKKHDLLFIADAAHGSNASYKGRPLWSYGDLSTLSFHYTKNLHCGEGGALIINNPDFRKRAEIIWEKGTDRNAFIRGEVDKYTWRDVGSSFVMSEIVAAALYSQIKEAQEITEKRRNVYEKYKEFLSKGLQECPGLFKIPSLTPGAAIDGHMFFLLAPSFEAREKVRRGLSDRFHVQAFSHYVPLHLSAYGSQNCKTSPVPEVFRSEDLAKRLIRLPMHACLTHEEVQYTCECILTLFKEYRLSVEQGEKLIE